MENYVDNNLLIAMWSTHFSFADSFIDSSLYLRYNGKKEMEFGKEKLWGLYFRIY